MTTQDSNTDADERDPRDGFKLDTEIREQDPTGGFKLDRELGEENDDR